MKKYINFAAAIAVILTMAGCSGESKSAEIPTQETVSQTEYVMQDGDTQVTGEVTEIIGNEVTLALGELTESRGKIPKNDEKAERPANSEKPENLENGESPQMPANGEMPEGVEGFSNGEMPSLPEKKTAAEGFEGFENGGKPEMPEGLEASKHPEGGRGEKNMKGSKNGFSSIKKSGETTTYTIPAGMTISGANGRSRDYSSITAGNILRLTINSEGYVVAAEII